MSTNKFEQLREKQKQIDELITLLTDYAEDLSPNFDYANNEPKDEITQLIDAIDNSKTQKELLKKLNINYNDPRLTADDTIPHALSETFTHKKPCAFEFQGQRIEVSYWRELLAKTCECLYCIDNNKFRSFLNDTKMNGESRTYFSTDKKIIAEPQKINGTDIYVIGNVNANFVRDLIVRMLRQFNIPKNSYLIYICRDLSLLHTTEGTANSSDSTTHITETNSKKSDTTLKIGKYVRNTLEDIFSHKITDTELRNMQNKEWSQDNLGIRYPLLIPYIPTIPINQQGIINSYQRYYTKPIKINNKDFLLCKEWYENFREKFDNWIAFRDITPPTKKQYLKISHDGVSLVVEKYIVEYVLKQMLNQMLNNNVIIITSLNKQCSHILKNVTEYKNPTIIIYRLVSKLCGISVIDHAPGTKQGKYIITDKNRFECLIEDSELLGD